MNENLTINLDIEEAMLQGELKVHYQPVFNIQSDVPGIVEAESFARWEHPDLGILSPTDLNIWEASNRITKQLTDYVIQRVIEQHVAWRNQDLFLPVSVHFSITMLRDPAFPQRLSGLMSEHGVDNRLLIVKLCQPRVAVLSQSEINTLIELNDAGFKVVLGNFASQAEKLTDLIEIPLAGIRIESEITKNLIANKRARNLVAGLISLAHKVDIPVYAEKVETMQSVELLKRIGCDLAQGWCLGKPVNAKELRNWFQLSKHDTLLMAN